MDRTIIALCFLSALLAACANNSPVARPALTTEALRGPECGARIFVVMGVNHKFPMNEDLRIPRGELYLNGTIVDIVSKNPEISVIDVPASSIQLSWIPADYGSFDRGKTKQNPLTLSLANGQVAYVSLEYYDDTSEAATFLFGPIGTLATVGFRTEVAQAPNQSIIAGKRIVFHRPLPEPCTNIASSETVPGPPAQRVDHPNLRKSKSYIVSAQSGAPAFAAEVAEGEPLHTFANGTVLKTVDVSRDGRWLRVLLPDGRIGLVPLALTQAQQ